MALLKIVLVAASCCSLVMACPPDSSSGSGSKGGDGGSSGSSSSVTYAGTACQATSASDNSVFYYCANTADGKCMSGDTVPSSVTWTPTSFSDCCNKGKLLVSGIKGSYGTVKNSDNTYSKIVEICTNGVYYSCTGGSYGVSCTDFPQTCVQSGQTAVNNFTDYGSCCNSIGSYAVAYVGNIQYCSANSAAMNYQLSSGGSSSGGAQSQLLSGGGSSAPAQHGSPQSAPLPAPRQQGTGQSARLGK